MATLNRLLSLAYWVEAAPGPLSPLGQALSLLLGLLLAAGAVASLWAMSGRLARWLRAAAGCKPGLRRAAAAVRACPAAYWGLEALSCALALAAVALRLAGVPGWSARVWSALPAALALALVPAAAWLAPAWPALAQGWRDLWAFRPAPRPLAPGRALVLVALHGLALVISVRLAGWPLWSAPALFLALLLPQLLGQPWAVQGWQALVPAYLLALAVAGQRLALYLGWPSAGPALPLGPALALLAAYDGAYQAHTLWPARRRLLVWAPAVLLGTATLIWAAWAYLGLYARGVTGSDPYCYVQMAVDFARRGTVVHRFALAGLAGRLQIDPVPLLHVGYRLPLDAAGRAATVWPVGHSLLLGLAGRLGGDAAIYLATPLMALACIAATAWLGRLLFDDLPPPLAWLVGSLAGLLVGTSFEQLRWTLVHMADISAQLFSILTVALTWLAARRAGRGYAWAAAGGLALALAYWVRHTQLAMALPALALLATVGTHGRRTRLWHSGLFLGVALLAALPDLAYHQRFFGSPLQPESEELALYALGAAPATTGLLLSGWLAAPELRYLAPFLLIGAAALAHRRRPVALALGLWLLGLWAAQAPYTALRLRDLLPALPALALLAGYGIVRALAWAAGRRREAATLLALTVVSLLWLRTADTATLPHRRSVNNFGYLWPGQRAEFAALRDLIEPDAAVGATLNSGPVHLYGERETFLPAGWPADDLRRFLQALQAEGRPIYLLDDGVEMAPVLARVRTYALLRPVALLRRVPYYEPDGGSEVRDVVLYRVERLDSRRPFDYNPSMGTLYVVGTPIGNLEDITLRALRVLREVRLIAAEDTRTARKLLARYEIGTPTTSYYEHNKGVKTPRVLAELAQGDVALISEAGMPGISDPGYELVRGAIAAGYPVVPVPGPTAVTTALAVSGLPADRFHFLGFLPRRQKERRELLQSVAGLPWTLVFFEAPHRILASLADVEEALGDRDVTAARELTKLHEELHRGTVSELRRQLEAGDRRGEFTIVVAGARPAAPAAWPREQVVAALREYAARGAPAKEAARRVSEAAGWKTREVYDLYTELKHEA